MWNSAVNVPYITFPPVNINIDFEINFFGFYIFSIKCFRKRFISRVLSMELTEEENHKG